MNICEPEIVFLTVLNADEAAFNKSDKTLRRSLMSAGAKFEATWVYRSGFQKWLAVKCDTDDILATVEAAMADSNVSTCTKDGFLEGGRKARTECGRSDHKSGCAGDKV